MPTILNNLHWVDACLPLLQDHLPMLMTGLYFSVINPRNNLIKLWIHALLGKFHCNRCTHDTHFGGSLTFSGFSWINFLLSSFWWLSWNIGSKCCGWFYVTEVRLNAGKLCYRQTKLGCSGFGHPRLKITIMPESLQWLYNREPSFHLEWNVRLAATNNSFICSWQPCWVCLPELKIQGGSLVPRLPCSQVQTLQPWRLFSHEQLQG